MDTFFSYRVIVSGFVRFSRIPFIISFLFCSVLFCVGLELGMTVGVQILCLAMLVIVAEMV